jgi:hypothetical protein
MIIKPSREWSAMPTATLEETRRILVKEMEQATINYQKVMASNQRKVAEIETILLARRLK